MLINLLILSNKLSNFRHIYTQNSLLLNLFLSLFSFLFFSIYSPNYILSLFLIFLINSHFFDLYPITLFLTNLTFINKIPHLSILNIPPIFHILSITSINPIISIINPYNPNKTFSLPHLNFHSSINPIKISIISNTNSNILLLILKKHYQKFSQKNQLSLYIIY
jgi:hypothetical protein